MYPAYIKQQKGFALIWSLIIVAVISVIVIVTLTLSQLSLRISNQNIRQLSSLEVAEAGINYYLWHLAHDPGDYCDGNACPPGSGPFGPYEHEYTNSGGEVVGTFTLWIAAPAISEGGKVTVCHNPGANQVTITVAPSAVQAHLDHGDTVGACEGGGSGVGGGVVTVESRGDVEGGNENRTVIAQLGIPSFAQYAVVANDFMRFGSGTETFGPLHSNSGIRFDGLAHELVTSSVATYNDPDHSGGDEFGVHTHTNPVDPLPPASVPSRPDVFEGGRQFPVPQVDFDAISSDLSNLKDLANSDGVYIGSGGSNGWHIVLNTNDTYDLYRVKRVYSSNGCGNQLSIMTEKLISSGNLFPNNGVIFVEDNLWIDGMIDGARLTITAAKIGATPANERSIIVNNDLEYSNDDGTDVIGLVAQNDFSVGLRSEGDFSGDPDNEELKIDAAIIAQNGRAGRNWYSPSWCGSNWDRNTITIKGSLATNERYGFAWTDGNGYDFRNLIYDQNLTLSPPPFFPTVGNFAILDWREQ